MEITNWTFLYPGFEPLSCQAPCTMYSVLTDHGCIPDPFYRENDQHLTALADRDCAFEARFSVDRETLRRDFAELTFYGLDTLCTIFLNGKKLDSVQNMHRTYTYEVKKELREGENLLRLEFRSPTKYFAERHNLHYLYTNDGDTIPGAAHLRKALYQSGWDWGPALPDMGIWRSVILRAYDLDRIGDVEILQDHHDGVVDLTVIAETVHGSNAVLTADLDGRTVTLEQGRGTVRIESPRLWWVRGYGDQPLYDLTITLQKGGRVLDTCIKRIGLRTLTVSTKPDRDKKGSEFCFVINGVKIFAMGANYIPQDSLLTRVTPEKTEKLIRQAVDANFNSLRVWGGGVYPGDDFYDLCDRYGILVWQDFMIACANVWMTPEFSAECAAEAADNLRRLRHHPSLGLFCGNNEMELAVMSWGIGESHLVREDYIELYERVLPRVAENVAPQVFYWPSSPCSGGGFDDPGNFARGDTHYWEVWHGGVPFTAYREKHFRFCSEYGFEAFPSMKTIASFCTPEDCNCFSRVMENHQKCKGGNGKILCYLADNYLYPHSFDKLVYASQLLQADAIRYAVEHFRRERGYCMGSMYWQFNDCWPVASWSSVDYFGRYKALHYAAKKFYAPVAMGLFLENGVLTVNLSNETRADFEGRIRMSLRKNDLTELAGAEETVSVRALRSRDVWEYEVPQADPHDTYLAVDLYDQSEHFIMRQTELLVAPKHFDWKKPLFDVNFRQEEDGVSIEISADVFARGVFLDFRDFDCRLSDNFLSLTDGKPVTVFAFTRHSADELAANLTVTSVRDIR